jgi:hypothetical protein
MYIFQAASLLGVLEEGEGKMCDILDDIDKMVLHYLLYWYRSTNTDATSLSARRDQQRRGGERRGVCQS